jgi:hypothetical protein
MSGPWEDWASSQTGVQASPSSGPWALWARPQKRGFTATPDYVSGPDGKEINLHEGMTEEEADAFDDAKRQKAADEEQKALDSRSYAQRAGDALAFGLQLPGRLLSGGKYGTADALDRVTPGMAEVMRGGERSFAGANRDALEKVGAAGEVAMGIPELGSLGATGKELAAMAKLSSEASTAARSATKVAGRAQTVANAEERLKDAQAFRDLGIDPFGPALADKGIARINRNIEEFPLVGRVVKEPKLGVEAQLGEAQAQIAADLGAPASDEGAGLIVQRGLDRYRTAKLQDLEPGTSEALGIPANDPTVSSAPGRVLAGGAPPQKVSQFSTSKMSKDQLDAAAARGDTSGVSFSEGGRREVSDLSNEEINRILSSPSRDTSFHVVQEAAYEKAHRMIPKIPDGIGGKLDPVLSTPESASVVGNILSKEKSAQISGGVTDGRFGHLVSTLAENKGLTLDGLRAARTEVGRALNNFSVYDSRLDRTQLKQIYGALTTDIETGVVSLAAQARNASRLPRRLRNGIPNPEYVPPSVADQADKALYNLRVADRYTRASMNRMDNFMNMLGANTLDEAGRKVGRYVREKTSDLGALRAVKSALRPEEWDAVVGHVVGGFGKGRPGAAEAEASAFNANHVATDIAKLSPQAKNILFGRDTPLRQSIERLARVTARMKYYESTKNTSGTAYSMVAGGLSLGIMAHPATILPLIAQIGGTAATGRMFTSQKYVRWLENAYKKEAAGASNSQMEAHLRDLVAIASKDPEIGHVVLKAIAVARHNSEKPATPPAAFIPMPGAGDGVSATTR